LAEKEGWVRRDKLLDFNGRLRTPQMRLAKELGLCNYAHPAGGCLLTDPGFSRRLSELMIHHELSLENLELLKTGRHFRLADKTRLVVGRDEKENKQLAKLGRSGDYLFCPPKNLPGPTALARGVIDWEAISLSAQITYAYTDHKDSEDTGIFYRKLPAAKLNVQPVSYLPKERFKHLFI
jgi:hypothetical protein